MKSLLIIPAILLAIGYPAEIVAQTSKEKSEKEITLPVIELNVGYGFLLSDNGLTTGLGGSNAQLNYQLSINQRILPFLSAGLNLGTTTFADERMLSMAANLNYRTVVFSQDLSFYYELSHLFEEKTSGVKPFQPYIGFGVGLISFRSKGDLKNENGIEYHYWSDGSIRSIAENEPDAETSILLMRDREFESDLRDANLDGLGRYDQLAFRLPLEVGFRYQITKNVGVNLKVRYHLNFTDLIDNVSDLSTGERTGTSGNDNHITSSIGISAFLGRHSKKSQQIPEAPLLAAETGIDSLNTPNQPTENEPSNKEKDEVVLEESTSTNELSENDGAKSTSTSEPELDDQSKSNPSDSVALAVNQEYNDEIITRDSSESVENLNLGAKDQTVDVDSIRDDVANEIENASAKTSSENVTKSEQEPTEISSYQTENPSSSEIDILEAMEGLDNTKPKEVGNYHWADVNHDRYISAEEVLHFIDILFDGDSEYTIPKIHSLIEYYFDQD